SWAGSDLRAPRLAASLPSPLAGRAAAPGPPGGLSSGEETTWLVLRLGRGLRYNQMVTDLRRADRAPGRCRAGEPLCLAAGAHRPLLQSEPRGAQTQSRREGCGLCASVVSPSS